MNKFEWFNKIITLKIAAETCRVDPCEEDRFLSSYKCSGAYVIVHPLTRQVYVGSTENLATRKYKHLWHIKNGTHRNSKIKEAFQRNPVENVFFFIWPTNTRDEAYDIEQQFLDASINSDKSLNIASNARLNGKDVVRSPELRKRISKAVKEKWQDPNHRELKSRLAKEYMANSENKQRMIERVTEVCNRPEFKAKQAEIANQQWSDPEARKRKSEEVKKYFQNPENLKKHYLAHQHRGKTISVDGVLFPSRRAVADHFGISIHAVLGRILSPKRPTWFYVKDKK